MRVELSQLTNVGRPTQTCLAPLRSPAVVGVGPLASSALIDVNSQPLGSNERDAQALRLVINRAEWHRLGDGVSMALCFSQ